MSEQRPVVFCVAPSSGTISLPCQEQDGLAHNVPTAAGASVVSNEIAVQTVSSGTTRPVRRVYSSEEKRAFLVRWCETPQCSVAAIARELRVPQRSAQRWVKLYKESSQQGSVVPRAPATRLGPGHETFTHRHIDGHSAAALGEITHELVNHFKGSKVASTAVGSLVNNNCAYSVELEYKSERKHVAAEDSGGTDSVCGSEIELYSKNYVFLDEATIRIGQVGSGSWRSRSERPEIDSSCSKTTHAYVCGAFCSSDNVRVAVAIPALWPEEPEVLTKEEPGQLSAGFAFYEKLLLDLTGDVGSKCMCLVVSNKRLFKDIRIRSLLGRNGHRVKYLPLPPGESHRFGDFWIELVNRFRGDNVSHPGTFQERFNGAAQQVSAQYFQQTVKSAERACNHIQKPYLEAI